MKHLFIALSIAFCLSSCGNKDYDNLSCMETVQNVYPKAVVYPIPNKPFNFIVADSCGAVYHVKTMSKYTEITHKIIIKGCN